MCWWWHVVRWIEVEESIGLEEEADVRGRHYGIVLIPRHVGVAEGIPEHDILVLDGTILACPPDESISLAALVRIVTCGISFFFPIWSDPDVMINETRSFPPPCVGRSIGYSVVPGEELVADRSAVCIRHRWVDHLPHPRCIKIQVCQRLLFGGEVGCAGVECVLVGVRLVDRICDDIDLLYRVGDTVDAEVKPHVEEVLMVRSVEKRSNHCAVLRYLALPYGS